MCHHGGERKTTKSGSMVVEGPLATDSIPWSHNTARREYIIRILEGKATGPLHGKILTPFHDNPCRLAGVTLLSQAVGQRN